LIVEVSSHSPIVCLLVNCTAQQYFMQTMDKVEFEHKIFILIGVCHKILFDEVLTKDLNARGNYNNLQDAFYI